MAQSSRCMRRQTPQLQQRWIGCPQQAQRASRACLPSLHLCLLLRLQHRPMAWAQRLCLLQMLRLQQLPHLMRWRPPQVRLPQMLRLCHCQMRRPQQMRPCLPKLQAPLLLQSQLRCPH